jgi:hypothetical protein
VSACEVLRAVAPDVVLDERLVGGASLEAHGVALTDEAFEACATSDAVLLGAVGGSAGRPAQGMVRMPAMGSSGSELGWSCSRTCAPSAGTPLDRRSVDRADRRQVPRLAQPGDWATRCCRGPWPVAGRPTPTRGDVGAPSTARVGRAATRATESPTPGGRCGAAARARGAHRAISSPPRCLRPSVGPATRRTPVPRARRS